MKTRFLVILAALALLAMACDASSLIGQLMGQAQEEAEQAIETVVPTIAAVAPTKAGATKPSTGAPSGNPFTDAVNKARSATKYRVEFAMIFGATKNGKYTEEPFIDLRGEVDGKNSHMTSKGGILSLLSGDPTKPVEFIDADGKSYMKGVSMFGMTDPKVWYISDDKSASSGFADFAKPDEFRNFAGGKESDFKKARSESVDGQNCDVWVYDFKSVQNAAIIGLLGSSQDKNDFSAIDRADMSVWLCQDGFVHKYSYIYEGHDTKNANEKGAMKMNAHMWDFNNATIVVTAPKDAKPMPK